MTDQPMTVLVENKMYRDTNAVLAHVNQAVGDAIGHKRHGVVVMYPENTLRDTFFSDSYISPPGCGRDVTIPRQKSN
jgi:hypothetical protein